MTLLSFKSKAEIEIEEKATIKKSKEAVDEGIAKAKKCLNSPLFEEYAKQYAEAEKAIMERLFIIDTRESDLTKYAFKMKDAISELRHLKALLNSVRLKAKVIK